MKQIVKAIETLSKKPSYFSALLRNKNAVDTALSLAGSPVRPRLHAGLPRHQLPRPAPDGAPSPEGLPKIPVGSLDPVLVDSRINTAHMFRPFPRNDIVGALSDYSNELEPTWRHIIRPDDQPWVRGHIMQDMIIYPMCGYLTMAVEAAGQRATLAGKPFDKFVFKDATISRPLVIQEGSDTETNITLRPYTEGTRQSSKAWDEFKVFLDPGQELGRALPWSHPRRAEHRQQPCPRHRRC